MPDESRERWSSKLGIILAVAGSAVGLGNFLRFPAKAAANGGGAFMIPYLVALVLFGIPLMWIEWTTGRYGGAFGHRTAPGMFHRLWRHRAIKYFGLIGIFGPIVIFIYYTYIESWTLGYAFFSLFGEYAKATDQAAMKGFLQSYQGLNQTHFHGLAVAYAFFLATFLANCWVLFRGITKGIEWLCKWAMPLLFAIAVILAIRVLTLPPNPANPGQNILNGLGYMWNPDFSALKNPDVWLEAAGQIFFTLSVGIGVILTYASYLSRRDDVVLSGLTGASTNELAEVILGGTIIIPAAFLFFGQAEMADIAKSSPFDLGFVTMPLIFERLPVLNLFGAALPTGNLFGALWFLLLFLAGITSSVSLAQPAVAFLKDELGITKRKAAILFIVVTFILCQPVILFYGHGVLGELDFWGGTFCLVLFATIETILFGWFFGIDKAWTEMHYGADIRVPRLYRYVIKFVTPIFLLVILAAWFLQTGPPTLRPGNVSDWGGLCAKLRAWYASSPRVFREGPPMVEFLPGKAQDAVNQVAQGYKSRWDDTIGGPRMVQDPPIKWEQKSAILAGFNQLLEKPDLFEQPHFEDIRLPGSVQRFLRTDRAKWSKEDIQWLNRAVLETALPMHFGPRRAKIVEVVLMVDVADPDRPYILGTRIMLLVLLLGLFVGLQVAWHKRRDVWDRTEPLEDQP